MQIYHTKDCLHYEKYGHPERPERISSIMSALENRFEIVAPTEVGKLTLLETHTEGLVRSVEEGSYHDADTPVYDDIFRLAALSAGAAVEAMRSTLEGESTFSVMRPPGHHAGKDFLGGFCYFNNVAVAVIQALKQVDRVAIFDFDCHHGNGSEDIFYGDERVLYVSIHESPLFPGTGLITRKNCLNFPLPPGSTFDTYRSALDSALEAVSRFQPNLLAVSAGFDSHIADPLTTMRLDTESFGAIGKRIRELNIPGFSVLEGGYSDKLAESVIAYLEGME